MVQYQKEKWNGRPVLRSGCGAAAETKEENIRDVKWRPADRRAGGRAKWIKTEKVKQEDASKNGMEFHLREQGIWDECGLVPKSVGRGKELVEGEIQWVVGREENIGYVVQGHEFRNITLLVRLIHQIRKCHRPNQFLRRGGRDGQDSPRGCARGLQCCTQNRCSLGNRV